MNGINAVSSPRQVDSTETIEPSEEPSGGPFTKAFTKLSDHMEHLSKEAQAYYDTLENKTVLSNEATKLLQKVDNPEFRSEVIEFLKVHKVPHKKDWLDVYDLQELREGLENFKTSQTDFVAESQLKIQRVMQTYNTTATLMNSLQSMLAELNKTIIQAMR